MGIRNGRPQATTLVFLCLFGAFVVFALAMGLANPIQPGQDFHYHLMSAALTERDWIGDAAVTRLYRAISPLDANTLLYTLLFPFELALSPLRAFSVGVTLFCFVGYPVACAFALHLLRRPLWGALLAFPLIYVRSWSHGGFIPFVLAAPLLVVSVGAMDRLLLAVDLDAGSSGKRLPRKILALTAVTSLLTFLAHGHVYVWLMAILAAITVWMIASRMADHAWAPFAALHAGLRVGIVALVTVLPSLVLFGAWYVRTHRGANAAAASSWDIEPVTWQGRIAAIPPSFALAFDETEWKLVAFFLILCLAALLFAGRRRTRSVAPEIALVLTVASFFFLPWLVSLQSVAARQVDVALFLMPLVVYPGPPSSRARALLVVTAICVFGVARMTVIAGRLARLQDEVAGMLEIAKPCPPKGKEIAYVTFHMVSRHWHAMPMHQAHETFAAICQLDTPVYDSRVYPYNFAPIRYRDGLPAPITILVDDARWFEKSGLWDNFDYVLVHAWQPNDEDLRTTEGRAERVRVAGDWQLWKSRAR